MGGGSANYDVRSVRCLVMFPKESGCYPVPVDGVYLYGIGVRLLKRIGKSYLGHDRPFGAIHERDNGSLVAVCTDETLRVELGKNFLVPGETFLLCLVYLDKVRGSINVRIGHRFFSPEPVEDDHQVAHGAVEKVLLKDGLGCGSEAGEGRTRMERGTSTNEEETYDGDASSNDTLNSEEINTSEEDSCKCEGSIRDPAVKSVVIEKEVEEIFFSQKKLEYDCIESEANKVSLMGPPANADIDQGDEYVVLQTPTDSESMPTFFISSSWHLQADRMSASLSTSSISDVTISSNDAASDLYVVVESEF